VTKGQKGGVSGRVNGGMNERETRSCRTVKTRMGYHIRNKIEEGTRQTGEGGGGVRGCW